MKHVEDRARLFLWKPGKVGALLATLLGLLVSGLLWFSHERAQTRLEFSVQSTVSGQLQVFFATDGRFNEPMSRWYALRAGQRKEIVLERTGAQLVHVRIDPPSGGEVQLCGLRLALGTHVDGYAAVASHQLEQAGNGDCLTLSSMADATDPQVVLAGEAGLEVPLSTAKRWERLHQWVLYAGVVSLVGVLVSLRWLLLALIRRFARLRWLEWLDGQAHWVCAALMLALGSIYALQTPPGAVPDEGTHLAKVAKIHAGAPFGGSEGDLFPQVASMYGPISKYLDSKLPLSEEQVERQLNQPVICAPATSVLARGADPYFPHQYALATIAFASVCATDSSFGAFLYSARFLNLLLATLLVGIGVAFGGRAKWALVFIALLPMSMFQMASLSADSLVISLSIAWIGLTAGLASGQVQVHRVVPLLWVLAIAVGLLKPGAAWILASLLFCRDAFRRSGMSFMRGVACFLVFPWMLHLGLIAAVDSDSIVRAGVDPQANMRLLKIDPAAFLSLVGKTFLGDYGQHIYRMMIGILGWIDVPLSDWAYSLAGVALLAALFMGSNRADQFPWRWAAPASLVMAAGSLILISLPLYVRWTLLDAPVVQGLQGRYFLPTLAFIWAGAAMRSPDLIRAALLVLVIGAAVALNVDAFERLHQAYFVLGR